MKSTHTIMYTTLNDFDAHDILGSKKSIASLFADINKEKLYKYMATRAKHCLSYNF